MSGRVRLTFNGVEIRMAMRWGMPWLCLLDLSQVLGFDAAATREGLEKADLWKKCFGEGGAITMVPALSPFFLAALSEGQAANYCAWVGNALMPALCEMAKRGAITRNS